MKYTNHSNTLIKYMQYYGKHLHVEGSHFKGLFIHFFKIMTRVYNEMTNLSFDYQIVPSVFQRLYIPDVIKQSIYDLKYTHVYSFIYKHTRIHLKIYSKRSSDDFIFIYRKVVFILMFLMRFSTTHKDSIEISLYFTKHRKSLPKQGILNEINLNSAYTLPCNNDVYAHIYRKEEWVKVLIHEAIHFLNIDFSCVHDNAVEQLDQQFYRIIPLKKENIRLYEAYCEFWALQIHCSIIAFFDNMKRDIDYEKTFNKYENLLKNETKYSLFQMNKILNYNYLDYYDIVFNNNNYINKPVYSENTYAISYFIVKTILLFHQNEFIEWCLQNNSKRNPMMFVRTFDNMKAFFSFIHRFYRNEKFLDALEYSNYDVDRRSFFYSTTTMSLYEMY